MHTWTTSSTILVLALIAFVIGLVLMLSVVTKRDCELEADRANTVRSNLFLLLSIGAVLIVIAVQRLELGAAVKSLMA